MKTDLVLIAGHGAGDSGAVAGALAEREQTIVTVLGINDYITRTWLPPRPPTIVVTPKAPAPAGEELLRQRIDRINADFGADVVIVDVHYNVGGPGRLGSQVWYSQNAEATAGDESLQVARAIQEQFEQLHRERPPLMLSSASRFGGLGILDQTQGSAVLVEVRNLAAVGSAAETYADAAAIARGLAGYFAWSPITPAAADDRVAIADELERLAVRVRALSVGRG